MGETFHRFQAVAFAGNATLKELGAAYPQARRSPHELELPVGAGSMSIYPFGAVVFRNVESPAREEALARLRKEQPQLGEPVVQDEFTVREDPAGRSGVADGSLVIDRLAPGRAGIVSLTMAQSTAMEYYERIVEQMFERTSSIVDRLERTGGVSMRTRRLHQFIGAAIGTRSEVLSVLHLLDRPDATWDDPAMARIYDDLRAEFDLVDRFEALERKLRSVQEALELVLDVARDRRLWLLEAAIVALIVVEILLSLAQGGERNRPATLIPSATIQGIST